MRIAQSETLLFEPALPTAKAIPLIFAFPNTYSVGITSLGYQSIWAILASREEVQVSRLFLDAQETLPRSPQLVGFSFSWELDYGNILTLLERLEIPLLARERSQAQPLVFGGGPVLTANPEPFAEFFDLILLGDGETLVPDFINAYQTVRLESREKQLLYLSQIGGIYVPSLYVVDYRDSTGPITAITPLESAIPATVQKQTHRSNTLLTSTVVTPAAAWENIFMVEVVRSCPEMCRFCLASYLT
jgi:radical SAM superfamily enzyme YgiQ (UPF0313 family)